MLFKSSPFEKIFLFYLLPNSYKKQQNILYFLFANIKNNSIFATAISGSFIASWGDTQAANEGRL